MRILSVSIKVTGDCWHANGERLNGWDGWMVINQSSERGGGNMIKKLWRSVCFNFLPLPSPIHRPIINIRSGNGKNKHKFRVVVYLVSRPSSNTNIDIFFVVANFVYISFFAISVHFPFYRVWVQFLVSSICVQHHEANLEKEKVTCKLVNKPLNQPWETASTCLRINGK